jgi:UDP-N-acetylmuramate--alanine ligase
MTRADLEFRYRSCPTVEGLIVLSAVFATKTVSRKEQLEAELDGFRNHRRQTQPAEASAGCMFKNPQGAAAGKLIDQAGLKGKKVGGGESIRKTW